MHYCGRFNFDAMVYIIEICQTKNKEGHKKPKCKIKIGIHIFGRIVHIGSKALLGWEKIASDFKF